MSDDIQFFVAGIVATIVMVCLLYAVNSAGYWTGYSEGLRDGGYRCIEEKYGKVE